jgi:hypothetical protein
MTFRAETASYSAERRKSMGSIGAAPPDRLAGEATGHDFRW